MQVNAISPIKTQSFGSEAPSIDNKAMDAMNKLSSGLDTFQNVSEIGSSVTKTVKEEKNVYKEAILNGISKCGPISGLANNTVVQKIAGGIGSFFAFCTGTSNAAKQISQVAE